MRVVIKSNQLFQIVEYVSWRPEKEKQSEIKAMNGLLVDTDSKIWH